MSFGFQIHIYINEIIALSLHSLCHWEHNVSTRETYSFEVLLWYALKMHKHDSLWPIRKPIISITIWHRNLNRWIESEWAQKGKEKKRSHAFIFLFLSSNAMKESTKRGKRCKAYALDKLTGKLNRQQRHINDAHNTKCWNDACDKKAVFSDFYFIRKWVLFSFSFSSFPIFFSSHLFLIDVLCAVLVSLYIESSNASCAINRSI